jgi:hypothetical protein
MVQRVIRAEMVETLVRSGVSRAGAEALARTPEVTEDSVAYVCSLSKKPHVGARGAYIASVLGKPHEEIDGLEVFAAQRIKVRAKAYGIVLEHARKVHAESMRAERERQMDSIQSAWPSLEEMACFGPLSHKELCGAIDDWKLLFARIVAAAQLHAEHQAADLESSPSSPLQSPRDHGQRNAGEEAPSWRA